MNDYLYSLALLILIIPFYLNLKREKERAKLEYNPMENLRIFQSYIIIIGLIIGSIYFLIR